MSAFHYHQQELYVEKVPLAQIAEQWGTPTYVYSFSSLLANYHAFTQALQEQEHLICYAVKANSNIALLNCLAKQGCGFDIVSLGELHRVLAAGGDVRKIVFSGVGKSELDIRNALDIGIACFNVESAPELDKIQMIAKRLNKPASISIRVNPNVDAKTHPYISTGLKIHKFGVDIDDALKLYQHAQSLSHIKIHGIDCHIGSQITSMEPFLEALDQVLDLIDQLKKSGIEIAHLNLGGGLGVRYHDETPPDISTYCAALVKHLRGRSIKLILEPGRALVANIGILLTRLEYIKQTPDKQFAIVDAAMNDLLRPSLYDAWHTILPVTKHPDISEKNYDVVGPVCETGDFFAKQRALKIKDHDLIAIMSAGAYGFSMSSNYNSRPRAAEIAVKGDSARVIRERESYSDLFKHEHLL
ncbi:MAG: diaminopimelate decarboxylase [Legionellales bacterium]|jgi:diaminopimelate decarboxylase